MPKHLEKLSLLFFASFLFVLLTPFINKANSSKDLIILMISFISSLEIINAILPDPKTFL